MWRHWGCRGLAREGGGLPARKGNNLSKVTTTANSDIQIASGHRYENIVCLALVSIYIKPSESIYSSLVHTGSALSRHRRHRWGPTG